MTEGLSPAVYARDARTSRLSLSPRTASASLRAALITLTLSVIAISLYFGGGGDFWGPLNDILVAATVLLFLPAVIVVRQLSARAAGGWLTVLTIAGLAGILIIAAGQVALVVGLIELETSFATGTVGVLMVVTWLAGSGVLAVRSRVLSRSVGWWALAFVGAVAATAVAIPMVSADTPTLSLLFGGPLLIALVGWMLSLARDLGRRDARGQGT